MNNASAESMDYIRAWYALGIRPNDKQNKFGLGEIRRRVADTLSSLEERHYHHFCCDAWGVKK